MSDPVAPSTSTPQTSIFAVPASETLSTVEAAHSKENKPPPNHPALATSKRKFHALLENLTKRPATKRSQDSLSSSRDSPAKRIRLEARARLEAGGLAGTSVGAHIQNQLLRARLEAARNGASKSTASEQTQTQREPNYVPWSHEAFLRRLKTFADPLKWTSKPDAVNEVAWARRGWVCVGSNTVCCKGGCEQRVVVRLESTRSDEFEENVGSDDYAAEIEKDLTKRFEELIVQGHEEDCLWRDTGCRDDIYHIPIARPSVWQPELQRRYESFAKMSSSLPPRQKLQPPIDIEVITAMLPSSLLLRETPLNGAVDANSTAIESGYSPLEHGINHTALHFALLGWNGRQESRGDAIATCETCFRRLGLWLYNADTTLRVPQRERIVAHAGEMSDDSEAMATNEDQDKSFALDLLDNHRDYCPWINGASQSVPGSMAGHPAYKVLRKCIENDAGFRGIKVRPSSSASYRSVSEVGGNETRSSDEQFSVSSPTSTLRTKQEIAQEDNARFERLKQLRKAIGLKSLGLKAKLGRSKDRPAS